MNVFVSYSPTDSELVSEIVSVLCANNSALACCDSDAIRTPGGAHGDVRSVIAASDVVLVFWCYHSFTSYDVRKESDLAIELGKDVIPLLFDDAPLPRKLTGRRCIDFRGRSGTMHEGSPEQGQAKDLAVKTEVDRLIATDLSRQYEDLVIMGLVRDIQTELASRFGPQ